MSLKDSLLTPSDKIEIRKAINRYILARGWMRRNFEKATSEEQERYQKVSGYFDSVWKKHKSKMSSDDVDNFEELLKSETQVPENKTHEYDVEKKPEEKQETVVEQKPEGFKEKKKTRQVRQIKKPNIKNNQPELF